MRRVPHPLFTLGRSHYPRVSRVFRRCYARPHLSQKLAYRRGVSHTPTPEPRPKGRKPAPPASPDAPADRAPKASWLEGPSAALGPAGRWPGERLGLPQVGPGSMAGYGTRIGALFVDWFASLGIASLIKHFTHDTSRNDVGTIALAVFIVELVVFVSVLGASFGQALFGLRIVRADNGGRPGFVRALGRTLLLAIVIPAVVTDRDGRGLHDRAVNTVLVKAR